MTKCISVLFFVLYCLSSSSQGDVVSWSAVKLSTNIDDNTKIEVKPILRMNNNLSDYQNASIDIVIKRNFGKKWYGQHLYRHWFIPGTIRRNFIWFDLGYVTSLSNSNMSSGTSLRVHWALDTGGQTLPDFLRLKQTFRIFNNQKLTPTLALEGWYRYTRGADFAVLRIEPGFIWKIAKGYSFSFVYRIQNRESAPAPPSEHHLVSTLSYSF